LVFSNIFFFGVSDSDELKLDSEEVSSLELSDDDSDSDNCFLGSFLILSNFFLSGVFDSDDSDLFLVCLFF